MAAGASKRRPAVPAAPELGAGYAATTSVRTTQSLRLRWRAVAALLLAIMTAAYWLASQNLPAANPAVADGLRNLFIAAALLTVALGLTLPGQTARAADEVSDAALRLASGTLAELSRAIRALGAGHLDDVNAPVDVAILQARSCDELGRMAACFNQMQAEIARIVIGLDGAREGLRQRTVEAEHLKLTLRQQVRELAPEIAAAQRFLVEPKPANAATKAQPKKTVAPAPRRERPTPKPAPAAPFSSRRVAQF